MLSGASNVAANRIQSIDKHFFELLVYVNWKKLRSFVILGKKKKKGNLCIQ